MKYPETKVFGDEARPRWVYRFKPGYLETLSAIPSPVLDIGAGHRQNRELFKNNYYISLDLDPLCKPDIISDAQKLPIKTSSLNGVICINLLEHILEYENVLSEIYRILRQKGKIFVYVPFLYPYHGHPNDYLRFTPKGLSGTLEKFGFKVEKLVPVYQGFFSMLSRFLIAWSYDKPKIIKALIQALAFMGLILFLKIDLSRKRFAVFIYCVGARI